MTESASILEWLIKLGGPGIAIIYLLYALRTSQAETKEAREDLRKSHEARMQDLVTVTGDMRAALVTSTEVMRANNTIQDKAGTSAGNIAKAVESFKEAIERIEDRINDLYRIMSGHKP